MLPFAVVRTGASKVGQSQAVLDPGLSWCRFDDATLYWRPGGESGALPADVLRLAGPPESARGQLYLVVQVGNAFLNEFPAARVAVNKRERLAVLESLL